MSTIDETLKCELRKIEPLNLQAQEKAQKRWDSIAKPLGGLGLLEKLIVQIAGIQGSSEVKLADKCVVVFCADNGVVEEGVTQTSQEVTAVVAENMTKGITSVCNMARIAGADVIPVDMGVARDITGEGLLYHKIAYGTNNMTKSPAMTESQALDGIGYGIELAGKLKEKGYNIFATGEMGIGNTTTSSALVSVLLDLPVELVTGRGAGLSQEGLERKKKAIQKAIELHKPNPERPLEVLSKVGGFDLAGMVGLYLGGAIHHTPIIVDGFISAAAALVAVKLCPTVREYLIASHISKEPAGKILLDSLGLQPPLDCGMCLGEGTGAVTVFPLLDMALSVYSNMSTFSDIEIEEYVPLA